MTEWLSADTLLDGRYRLLRPLGEGGMGAVYEAEDLRLSRPVAVKVMRRYEAWNEQAGERLFREARAAARADHPAVVTTYGFGTDEDCGLSYVVMERLRGETLGERIARGPMAIGFVFNLAAQVLDALAAVHEAQVVHRDLKPSNIFLASRGLRVDEVKLLDFGVAKLLDLQTLTATGETYGTLRYMAPEQLINPREADARSDLYSLGIVLYECLTGESPFLASKLVPLTAEILLGGAFDVRAKRAECPAALEGFVSRCARARADERFSDARAAALALREAAVASKELAPT